MLTLLVNVAKCSRNERIEPSPAMGGVARIRSRRAIRVQHDGGSRQVRLSMRLGNII